jgi:DNA polymerase IV
MSAFCRICLADAVPETTRCKACGSRAIASHVELDTLAIAHLDCDAFYATVEKRDNPALLDKPVIVGGGKRGVVLTACYVARTFGAKSAMPMFKALKLCPQAIVVKPRMAKYVEVARQVRALMRELTPLVEPVSLDEAYLDLSGTERLHHISPAKTMAALVSRIEREIGITASVGLSFNKFLAKLASDLDKPRGFAVIGRAEARDFLRDKPVGFIRGAGAVLQARLAKDGFTRIAQLQDAGARELGKRYGNTGLWLHRLAKCGRRSCGRSRRRDEEHLIGDHFRTGHLQSCGTGEDPLAAGRTRLRAGQGVAAWRPHRRAQTQDGSIQNPHAQPVA